MSTSLRSSAPRIRRRTFVALSTLLILAVLAVQGILGSPAAPAFADDVYPSWDDVLNAQKNEGDKQAEIVNVKAELVNLTQQVDAAKAAADQANAANDEAQVALVSAEDKADLLAGQAASAQTKADASRKQAAELAGQFARSGGQNVTSLLLTSSSRDADDLLSRLGSMSKLSETVAHIYAAAEQDSNLAASLSEQSKIAEQERTKLADDAQTKLVAAADQQKKMIDAYTAKTDHENELNAQLDALTKNLQTTQAQYEAGERAREAAEAAAAAAAAAALLKAQLDAAAAAAANNGGGGGGGDVGVAPSDAQAVAQVLMGYVNTGQLSGSYPDHIPEIQWIAQGMDVPNCGIDTQMLLVILLAVQDFGSAGVSDINRRCTGQIEGAGIYSLHYVRGGGHAVDFYSLGGQAVNGADQKSLDFIGVLDPIMPYGSGLGQSQCRYAAGDEPGFQNFIDFEDTCNHFHVNDAS
jgi:hypothetical protein